MAKFEISYGAKAVAKRTHGFGGGRPSDYPWDDMPAPQEGQDEAGNPVMAYAQFFVPGKTTKNFSGLAQNTSKRLTKAGTPTTFKVTAAEENGVAGVLVQRVEYRPVRERTAEEKAALKAKREANKAAKAA